MNDEQTLEKARERVIEAIAKNIDLYGVTHSIGRMYGTMFFSDRPMGLEELGTSLGMSKTSMSAGVRVLTELKMVEKVWLKGVRKDLYQAELDWHKTFIEYFDGKWRKAVTMNIEQITKSLHEIKQIASDPNVSDEIRKAATSDVAKLEDALLYYDWLLRFIDCLESGEIFQFIPKKKNF